MWWDKVERKNKTKTQVKAGKHTIKYSYDKENSL